jgi:hypothetical protein
MWHFVTPVKEKKNILLLEIDPSIFETDEELKIDLSNKKTILDHSLIPFKKFFSPT